MECKQASAETGCAVVLGVEKKKKKKENLWTSCQVASHKSCSEDVGVRAEAGSVCGGGRDGGRGGEDLQREMFWVCLLVMWTAESRASVLDFIDFDDGRVIWGQMVWVWFQNLQTQDLIERSSEKQTYLLLLHCERTDFRLWPSLHLFLRFHNAGHVWFYECTCQFSFISTDTLKTD